jgi:hypothetical protein
VRPFAESKNSGTVDTMSNIPYVRRTTPWTDEQKAFMEAEAARIRASVEEQRRLEEPARRAMLASGPSLRDLEAAVACGCSCHPRPAETRLHEGGVSCPCQSTPEERAAAFDDLRGVLQESSAGEFSYEARMREAMGAAASRLGVTIRHAGGWAPFVITGVVDGRGFYLRERHDCWSVEVASDDDPLADPYVLSSDVPTIVVAEGVSEALTVDGAFDTVRALEVAVHAVRLFLLRRVCSHPQAERFCPACGVEVADSAAWRVSASD